MFPQEGFRQRGLSPGGYLLLSEQTICAVTECKYHHNASTDGNLGSIFSGIQSGPNFWVHKKY